MSTATATFTSPGQQEIIDILKASPKALTSREIFTRAKGFEDADAVSKALNYAMKKGVVEREKVGQNTYAYWLASQQPANPDSGNTLLRGSDGNEDLIPAPIKAVISDALKPCPEIDAVTQEMANQAEVAYQTLSEALGMTPEQLCDMTLIDLADTASALLEEKMPPPNAEQLAKANRALIERMDAVIAELRKAYLLDNENALANDKYLVNTVSAIISELNSEHNKLSEMRETVAAQGITLAEIRRILDIYPGVDHSAIIAEVENISRLADRAIQIGARDAVNGPYVVITTVHTGEVADISVAREKAELVAKRSAEGRAAVAQIVASVSLAPVWRDAK